MAHCLMIDDLRPEGLLISSDLAGDLSAVPADGPGLLEIWLRLMRVSDTLPSPEEIECIREAYTRDVAVLPPGDVRGIIARGGFDSLVLFFQAGMIHAWYAKRSSGQGGAEAGNPQVRQK